MMLQIDCGNTRLKWLFVSDEGVVARGAGTLSGFDLDAFLSMVSDISPRRVLVSSVSEHEVLDRLLARLSAVGGMAVHLITHRDLPQDVHFAYDDVASLGIDRCMVVLAAGEDLAQGGLVLDCGSAMTADLILPSGQHLGGYIFPGYSMLRSTLLGGTAKVIVGDELEGSGFPGESTDQCVANAVYVMLKSSVSFLLELACRHGIGRVYITGGDSKRIESFFGGKCEVRPDMVFEGMALIADKVFLSGESG
jgi:type III pantothenate kinase